MATIGLFFACSMRGPKVRARRRVLFAGTAFFEKTYRDALSLLREAQGYLAYYREREVPGLTPLDRLHFSLESSRLTARLIDIMAWLFVQKALEAGEITADEAAREGHRVLRREAWLEGKQGNDRDANAPFATGNVPNGFASLVERSRRLYLRIVRLDELTAREPA
jgi:regulator of CtrA degradation